MQKPLDLWQVEGDAEIDHELGCSCEYDRYLLVFIRCQVRAATDEEAADTALVEREWRMSIDGMCHLRYSAPPKMLNLSQRERELEALRAWNAGEPIRVPQEAA